ncbi:MAG: CBS domain-containing protein [Thaumarchaeota archaeon]|nr:CBS domain-containing protein [Nitrososphaerota archaeon]
MKALVSDVTTPASRYVLVKETASIIDFFNTLSRGHDAEYGFVVDEQGRLKGMITPVQLLNFCKVKLASGAEDMSSRELMKYLNSRDVRDIMMPAVSVRPSDNIRTALILMGRHSLETLPITDKDGKVLGDINFMEIMEYSIETHVKANAKLV